MSNKFIWNFWAKHYENLWVQKVSLEPVRKSVLEEMTPLLCDNLKQYAILDVGCGTGQTLREIAAFFPNLQMTLTGIDYSEKMIETAKTKTLINSRIKYIHMDVDQIKDLKENYDIIICTHSFPYYKNQQKVMWDMMELLKSNGRLFLAHASVNNFYDRMVMFFVKFTTGRAHYPSISETIKTGIGVSKCLKRIEIKTSIYMPSIYLFVMGRG
ncbi:MAG: class I SAM-dependent methyltransferase [Tissierellales bacterium]|nr:class I SAM-dependent methyltransferase [Tissierellales bacterium]MBN2828281.1 class I SAM-dependent methyltransferase [Tissierellales bacterium]